MRAKCDWGSEVMQASSVSARNRPSDVDIEGVDFTASHNEIGVRAVIFGIAAGIEVLGPTGRTNVADLTPISGDH